MQFNRTMLNWNINIWKGTNHQEARIQDKIMTIINKRVGVTASFVQSDFEHKHRVSQVFTMDGWMDGWWGDGYKYVLNSKECCTDQWSQIIMIRRCRGGTVQNCLQQRWYHLPLAGIVRTELNIVKAEHRLLLHSTSQCAPAKVFVVIRAD